MRRVPLALAVLALAACRHAPSAPPVADDCKVVHDDPTHAMAILSQRHPKDPIKVAQVIEGCVAPAGGDECDRVAALVKAIPQMAPALAPRSGSSSLDAVAVCRGMPPAMRHCMLASYSLAHDAECTKVREDLAKTAMPKIDLQPSAAPACDGGAIAVYVAKAGLWLGTGTDARGRCFAKQAGGYDFAWLERQLHHYDAAACKPAVEIAAEHDVAYQDVIHAMDVAVKVGLANVAIDAPADLPVPLAAAQPEGAPADCPEGSIHRTAAAASSPRGLPSSTDQLKAAPVVIVTRTEIELAGKTVVKLDELGTGTGSITELTAALPTPPAGPTAILQADKDTPSGVITRVVHTLSSSGYSNVLFAVKNK